MKIYSVPSVDDVRSCITPVLVGKDEDPEFQYTDAETDRQFSITQMADGSYFMTEAIPSGRRYKLVNGNAQFFDCDIAMAHKDGNPNGFRDTMREHRVRTDQLVFDLGGGCLGMIVHPTLEDCAAAIVKSIQDNTWYRYFEPRSEQDMVKDARQAAMESHRYWKGVLETIDENDGDGTSLFAGTSTFTGAPLDQDARQRVLAYLNAPSQEGWLAVRDMGITTLKTWWLAWTEIDRNAPFSGREGFPDADTARRAIRHAVDATRERAKQKLVENPSPTGLRAVK